MFHEPPWALPLEMKRLLQAAVDGGQENVVTDELDARSTGLMAAQQLGLGLESPNPIGEEIQSQPKAVGFSAVLPACLPSIRALANFLSCACGRQS